MTLVYIYIMIKVEMVETQRYIIYHDESVISFHYVTHYQTEILLSQCDMKRTSYGCDMMSLEVLKVSYNCFV